MSDGAEAMLRAVQRDFRELEARLGGRWRLDERVAEALRAVPRDRFVGPGSDAWANTAQAIDCGQTISQPFIVALMTQLALPLPPPGGGPVLEIGTGSGYQAAVLAALGCEVLTVERHAALVDSAIENLSALGVARVTARIGDGSLGWPEQAPFERIIVTAGAERLPAALGAQLAVGGRMVIPVGPRSGTQQLRVVCRTAAEELREEAVIPVRFVPLVGGG